MYEFYTKLADNPHMISFSLRFIILLLHEKRNFWRGFFFHFVSLCLSYARNFWNKYSFQTYIIMFYLLPNSSLKIKSNHFCIIAIGTVPQCCTPHRHVLMGDSVRIQTPTRGVVIFQVWSSKVQASSPTGRISSWSHQACGSDQISSSQNKDQLPQGFWGARPCRWW